MKRLFSVVMLLSVALTAMAAKPKFEIKHVEPLSWWVGMNTPLQLMVNGDGISAYNVDITPKDKGVEVAKVHKADSPNYLFVDVNIAADAVPGTYTLIFSDGKRSYKYDYVIAERVAGSKERASFTTADMVYLIMPDRFANGNPANDSTDDTTEKALRSNPGRRHGGDLQGMIDHLDYIADLGATAVWATPLLLDNENGASYHGYSCSDYYLIDPRFGTNELFKEYVEKCHTHDLKVIMDIQVLYAPL